MAKFKKKELNEIINTVSLLPIDIDPEGTEPVDFNTSSNGTTDQAFDNYNDPQDKRYLTTFPHNTVVGSHIYKMFDKNIEETTKAMANKGKPTEKMITTIEGFNMFFNKLNKIKSLNNRFKILKRYLESMNDEEKHPFMRYLEEVNNNITMLTEANRKLEGKRIKLNSKFLDICKKNSERIEGSGRTFLENLVKTGEISYENLKRFDNNYRTNDDYKQNIDSNVGKTLQRLLELWTSSVNNGRSETEKTKRELTKGLATSDGVITEEKSLVLDEKKKRKKARKKRSRIFGARFIPAGFGHTLVSQENPVENEPEDSDNFGGESNFGGEGGGE